eukprot:TRINITY_DN15241_c0_g1_i1.p1 TRINITY_DN15241_c0_g1~~TRINITY_DN15241_c0_g1_i1.p1  ORF type:complete len:229 (-),score=50.20 TRINITY_DN15241_c0_g1_i1:462-1064(-)
MAMKVTMEEEFIEIPNLFNEKDIRVDIYKIKENSEIIAKEMANKIVLFEEYYPILELKMGERCYLNKINRDKSSYGTNYCFLAQFLKIPSDAKMELKSEHDTFEYDAFDIFLLYERYILIHLNKFLLQDNTDYEMIEGDLKSSIINIHPLSKKHYKNNVHLSIKFCVPRCEMVEEEMGNKMQCEEDRIGRSKFCKEHNKK